MIHAPAGRGLNIRSAAGSKSMKKIFLTSIKIDLLPKLIPIDPVKSKLVFIPTAANPYYDKWFVEADRRKLGELGFKPIELDLNGQTPERLKIALQGADIVYIAGGNSCRK